MLQRLRAVQHYNRDWLKYALCRYRRCNTEVTFRLRNGRTITTFADAAWVLNEIYVDRIYEVPGVDWGKCRSVLDLGANAGAFALYVASLTKNATVFCFEPSSSAFRMLQGNLARNRVSAHAFRLAISDRCGFRHLLNDRLSTARSLGDSGEEVECVDLRRAFELTGVKRFDFVKMDVEGAELQILNGCTDDELRRIGALAVEWHHSASELNLTVARLRCLGFEAEGKNRFLRARLVVG